MSRSILKQKIAVIQDDDRPGRINTSTRSANVDQMKKIIMKNRQITIRES